MPAGRWKPWRTAGAHLLSRALNTRRELEALHGADAELYSRLCAVREEIRELRRTKMPAGSPPTPKAIERYRSLSNEGARVISELKQRPGFDRFLTPLPLGLADLRPAAAEGPVISININQRRCDALALCPDGLRAVPLPRLNAGDLAAQAESFRTAVEVLGTSPGSPWPLPPGRSSAESLAGCGTSWPNRCWMPWGSPDRRSPAHTGHGSGGRLPGCSTRFHCTPPGTMTGQALRYSTG